MALVSRSAVLKDPTAYNLPPSFRHPSALIRLERRGLLTPIKFNGDNSPAHYEVDELHSVAARCRAPLLHFLCTASAAGQHRGSKLALRAPICSRRHVIQIMPHCRRCAVTNGTAKSALTVALGQLGRFDP